MKSLGRIIFRWLAGRVLAKYQPLVIGIAGAVGKTATKDAIAAALQTEQRQVRKTEGSFNAEIGVPVAILRGGLAPKSIGDWLRVLMIGKKAWLFKQPYPPALVLEMGIDHPGDLANLISLAKPTIAVLTSTAPEHLEFFDSEDQVIAEESLMVRTLMPTGTAIINADDPGTISIKDKIKAKIVSYGWSTNADVRADGLLLTREANGRPTGMVLKIAVGGSVVPVAIPGVLGRHQAYPLLAAVAVAKVLGDDILSVIKRLSAYQPPAGRMRLLEGLQGSLIIDDSYNASPAAVLAAIEALAELEMPGKKYLILGQMSELGSAATRWHDQIGQALGRKKIELMITVGPLAKRIGAAAIAAGWVPEQVQNVESAEAAATILRAKINSGDAVLLKGSKYPKPGYGGFIRRAGALLLAHPDRDERLLAPAE